MNRISEVGKRVVKRKPVNGPAGQQTAKTSQVAAPITNPQLQEALKAHREEALKRGRKHKKPLKKARFQVMVGSLILILVLVIGFFGYSFYLLQNKQSYSNLAYSLSRLTPYDVSVVDGESVSYEEYLFILKQNVHYLVDFNGVNAERIDVRTEDGNRIIEQKKLEALSQAESHAFVRKQAKELNISVSNEEVKTAIDELLVYRGNSSREELATTLRAHYGWTLGDYERFYGDVLLKRKVLSSLDEDAKVKINSARERIAAGEEFGEVAKVLSEDEGSSVNGGKIGKVNIKLNGPNFSYTALEAISNLEEGAVSEVVITNDSFYLFKNVKTYSEDEKELEMIRVSFKSAEEYLSELSKDGKIRRNIKLKAEETQIIAE
jgi:parvulin-like peptidyl-prolyl isomerase